MKEINLTQGRVAIVDDADFGELSKHKWYYDHEYARRAIALDSGKQAQLYMHIAIMGKIDALELDHVNGDRLDNRRENLRHVTSAQNKQNQAPCRGITSQYKGVSWDKANKKWFAFIQADGKPCYLGRYKNESEAATAYNNAATKHFGQYARLNIIKEG